MKYLNRHYYPENIVVACAGSFEEEKLMQALWETDSFVDENTLTVNINRLRKKLDSAGLIHFITTKFGVGYLIES